MRLIYFLFCIFLILSCTSEKSPASVSDKIEISKENIVKNLLIIGDSTALSTAFRNEQFYTTIYPIDSFEQKERLQLNTFLDKLLNNQDLLLFNADNTRWKKEYLTTLSLLLKDKMVPVIFQNMDNTLTQELLAVTLDANIFWMKKKNNQEDTYKVIPLSPTGDMRLEFFNPQRTPTPDIKDDAKVRAFARQLSQEQLQEEENILAIQKMFEELNRPFTNEEIVSLVKHLL